MSVEDDLRRIEEQERRLVLQRFDPAEAWRLGVALKEAAEARGAGVAIDITVNGHTLFHVALAGTAPDNAEWIRRKRNLTLRLFRSSYAVGLKLQQSGATLQVKYGLPETDFAAHGGSFPLSLEGVGCVGAVTVSGLPQRQDHVLVVEMLARFLARDIGDVRLE